MKKIGGILLGIWCAFTSFITPFWLVVIFLNVTGFIYRYDYSMDEGTAGIIGVIALVLWLLLVLLPDIAFLKYVRSLNRKAMLIAIVVMILLAVSGIAMCNWRLWFSFAG